ncbi:MAG TPA: DUF1826 domain-containing protein [Porticoccaceae bacterium]|nr:DUF1826 domain-containing protein [Porticoccaceae bacterium]
MTAARPLTIPESRRSVYAKTPEALTDIYQSDIGMAVWKRQLRPSLISECEKLVAETAFPAYRVVLPEPKFKHLEDTFPRLVEFPLLRADIQLLAEMFCCLFELQAVGLRLTPLTTAMCPKFHVDRVPCRLITSYCGGGTQWLPHHHVNRDKLGAGSGGLSDADSGLYPSEDAIQTLGVGDIALLKGEQWEGNEGAGLVHRSPMVEAGQKRVLLTLDFA